MLRNFDPRRSDGETGTMLEERYFGTITITPKNRTATAQLLDELTAAAKSRDGVPPFMPSLRFVKKFQPAPDPTNPEPKVARDLRLSILKQLGIPATSPEAQRLKFFTAISNRGKEPLDSPLDRKHGVDAFYEYQHPDGRTVRVLIDVTKNTAIKRREDSEGDRVIMEPLPEYDRSETEPAYYLELASYAKQMARILNPELVEHLRERERTRIAAERPVEQMRVEGTVIRRRPK